MRNIRYLFLLPLAAVLLPVTSHGQTLGEVLRAIQKRNKLVQERPNVAIDLYNEETGSETEHNPIIDIQWNGTSAQPSDSAVDGLPVSTQLKLLRQAWDETNKLQRHFLEPRQISGGAGLWSPSNLEDRDPQINVETFPGLVQALANRLSHMDTLSWPLFWEYYSLESSEDGLSSVPTPPFTISSGDDTDAYRGFAISSEGSIHVGPGANGYAYGYASYIEGTDPAEYEQKYGKTGEWVSYTTIRGRGSNSFSGQIQIFSGFDYLVNGVGGLSWPGGIGGDGTAQTLYHPGHQRWANVTVGAGAGLASIEISAPGIFSGDASSLSFDGTLTEHEALWDPDGEYSKTYYLGQSFPNQNNSGLWSSMFDSQADNFQDYGKFTDEFYGDLDGESFGYNTELDFTSNAGDITSTAVFKANFGQEFSIPTLAVPEKPPLLKVTPDFANGKLKVLLANTPANECALVWQFPIEHYIFQQGEWMLSRGSLSARNALHVEGSGKWDAVYSGKPTDREAEIAWTGIANTANGRWPNFESYAKEWWRPVLTQLVCPTYGVKITQVNRSKYTIGFYRKDQVGTKSSTTGEYSFSGSPVETYTVENPDANDTQIGKLKITGADGTIFNTVLTRELDENNTLFRSTWDFTAAKDGHTFLSKNALVDNQTYFFTFVPMPVTTKVVDNTSVDGVALPKVTTTYLKTRDNNNVQEDAKRIDKIIEEGTDGTRTTTYSYQMGTDDDDLPIIDHLTGISQSGGVNPYTASYNDAEQLTHYTSGTYDLQIAYSGSTVTKTEKIGGSTVRTLATTYEDGLRKATTASGVTGAVSSIAEYFPGSDATFPWGPKLVRGFDGSVTTFSYSWDGSNLVTTAESAAAGGNVTSASAGTRTITKSNSAGYVYSTEVFDIASGAKTDFATATAYQNSVFPSQFNRPLGTTESFSYDGEGQILSYTDRLGKTSTYTPDAFGRITKIERNGLTWNVSYNPGHLGTTTTCGARSWVEQTSPFGKTQSLTITGPENITVSRTETSSSITTDTSNSTTGSTRHEVTQKGDLSTAITGNSTEPWNVSFDFPGNGWSVTTAHDSASAFKQTVTYDGVGRIAQTQTPNPTGSGLTTTTYAQNATNRQVTVTDPSGSTQFTFRSDGTLQAASRGSRSLTVGLSSSGTKITRTWTNALGETLWKRAYDASNGVTEDSPWGESSQKITITPSISGDEFTLGRSGPNLAETITWKDGTPHAGSFQDGAATLSWSALANGFGEVTSLTANPGGSNAVTVGYSALGFPESISSLAGVAANTINNAFSGGQLTSSATRNGHSVTQSHSSIGYLLGTTGYGQPDTTWSAPAIGSSAITRTLTTGAGAAQFTWNLAETLKERKFPDSSGESFTANPIGASNTWTTPGSSTLNLTPNQFGESTTLGGLGTIGYDNAGRINSVIDAAGTHTLTYTDGQIDVESHSGGPLSGQQVDRDYDSLGRLHTLMLPGNVSVTYNYGGNGELSTISTAGGATGTWSNYDAATGKAKGFSIGPLSVSANYNAFVKTTSQTSTAAAVTYGLSSIGYDGDGNTQTVGSRTVGYNTYGYLQSASGTPSYAYNFDEVCRTVGQSGEYRTTTRTNNLSVTVLGSVTPGAAVTINGSSVTATGGLFSQTYTPTPNSWQSYTIRGVLAGAGYNGTDAIAEEVRPIFVPPASESLSYDTAGNRKTDARWTYTWNALAQLTSAVDSNPSNATQLDYIYDVAGRLVQKKVTVGGTLTKRTTTLYDKWKPVLQIDYDGTGSEIGRRVYTWGPDISGTIDGAAGIGGLIEVLAKKGSATTRSLAINDGLGNVIGLVDGATGAKVATFTAGPFGEMLNVSGERASSCPLRFQTKTYDEELGLYYFGRRWYDPRTQSWLSRDPLRESGGANLYAYCNGQPYNFIDPIGGEPMTPEEAREKALRQERFGREHPWMSRIFGFTSTVTGSSPDRSAWRGRTSRCGRWLVRSLQPPS